MIAKHLSLFLLLFLTALAARPALAAHPAPLAVANSTAKSENDMKAYAEVIEHTPETIEMLPIRGGKFLMGSPDGEAGHSKDEGPQHEVEISPFWMAKCELTWDAYDVWVADTDLAHLKRTGTKLHERDKAAEAFQVSKPSLPYMDLSFGMGKRGYPAICMTQHSARVFCQWLSAKTGRYYRLPTEAEWEYACRAGTKTAYSFGDDPARLGDYAWLTKNSDDKYHQVGQKKPNLWGLYDMHGNVAEWVLDAHDEKFYSTPAAGLQNPLAIPLKEYPRVVRGGSWDDEAPLLRSAARVGSTPAWKQQDPCEPPSIWHFTDAQHVGFRIVRPLAEPSDAERAAKWDKSEPLQINRGR